MNNQHVYSDTDDEFPDDSDQFDELPPVVTESDTPIGVSPSVRVLTPRERHAISAPGSTQPIYTPPPLAAKPKRPTHAQLREEALEQAEHVARSGLNFYKDELRAEPAPREELVTELGITRDPIAIFGPGGWGKTKTLTTLAIAMATGADFIGRVGPWLPNGEVNREAVYKGRVWLCEDTPEKALTTMHAGFRHLGTHQNEIEYLTEHLVVCPRRGYDSVLMAPEHGRMRTTPVYNELKEELESNPADFLILDHIGHVFAGNNDDRVHVTQFINAMVALQPLKEYALILLGHPSRGDDSTYGGSIAWDYGVRQRWYMGGSPPGSKIKPEDGITYLTLEKANDRPKREPIRLEYRDGVFVPDAIVKNSSGVVVTRAEQALQFTTNCICDFLQEGIRVTSSAQSPDFLPKVLAHKGALGKFREDEIVQALTKLKVDGKLIEQEYGKTDQRKTKYTLAVKS